MSFGGTRIQLAHKDSTSKIVGQLYGPDRRSRLSRLYASKARATCEKPRPWLGALHIWWAVLGSNQRPLPCQGSALPLRQPPISCLDSVLRHSFRRGGEDGIRTRVDGFAGRCLASRPLHQVAETTGGPIASTRADDEIRTRDPHLGKVMRYHCATSALPAFLRARRLYPIRLARANRVTAVSRTRCAGELTL